MKKIKYMVKDSIITEEETKCLLSKENFRRILAHLKLETTQAESQNNFFFDTWDFALDYKSITMRVRSKGGILELTLKEGRKDEAKLETNYNPLSVAEYHILHQKGILPESKVKEAMERLRVTGPFILCGELITHRIEIDYKGCKLALDKSLYLDVVDYEIEMEKDDPTVNQYEILIALLVELNIPYVKAKGKRKRFFKQLDATNSRPMQMAKRFFSNLFKLLKLN